MGDKEEILREIKLFEELKKKTDPQKYNSMYGAAERQWQAEKRALEEKELKQKISAEKAESKESKSESGEARSEAGFFKNMMGVFGKVGKGFDAVGRGINRINQVKEGVKGAIAKVTPSAMTMLMIFAIGIHLLDTFVLKFQRGGYRTFMTISLYLILSAVATSTLGGTISNWKYFFLTALPLSALTFFAPFLVNLAKDFIPANFTVGILIFAPVWIIYLLYFTPSESRSNEMNTIATIYLILWMMLFTTYYISSIYGYTTAHELVQSLDITQPLTSIWNLLNETFNNFKCSFLALINPISGPPSDCDKYLKKANPEVQEGAIESASFSTLNFDLAVPDQRDFVAGTSVSIDNLGMNSVLNRIGELKAYPSCTIRNSDVPMEQPKEMTITPSSGEKLAEDYPKDMLDSYTFSCKTKTGMSVGQYNLEYNFDIKDIKTTSQLSFLVMGKDPFDQIIRGSGAINDVIKKSFPQNKLVQNMPSTGPLSVSPNDFVMLNLQLSNINGKNLIVYGLSDVEPKTTLKLGISIKNMRDGRIRQIKRLIITDLPAGMTLKDTASFKMIKDNIDGSTQWDFTSNALNTLAYQEKAQGETVYIGKFDVLVTDPKLEWESANQPSEPRTIKVEMDYDYGFKQLHKFTVASK